MKNIFILILFLLCSSVDVYAVRSTILSTDSPNQAWTKQNSMNLETYRKTTPSESGFTGMDASVIASGTINDSRIPPGIARDNEIIPSTIVPDTINNTKAAAAVNADAVPASGVVQDSTHRLVTDTEKSTWSGKQNALGFTAVPNSRTINGHDLSGNVTVSKSDVGLGNVPDTDATNPVNITQSSSYRFATDTEKSTWNAKVGPGDLASASVSHANTAASVDPVKTSGVPGIMAVSEAEGTSTLKTGFIGPANSTINFVYQFPNGIPSPGDMWVMGTPLAGQTLPDGSIGTIVPLTHAPAGGSPTDLLVSNFNSNAVVTASEALTQVSDDTMVPTWGAVLAKMNDIIASGNPTIAITAPATNGLWTGSTSYSAFAGTAFDMQGISEIATKVGSGGTYSTSGVTGTTTWSVSTMTLAEGLNTLYARVTDTTASTSEATRTLNVDSILPIVNSGADQTHNGTGQQITVSAISITEANETARERQIYNTTDSVVESAWATFTGTSFDYTLPANTDSYRFDVRVTDPVRAVTDSLNVTYAASGLTVNDTFDGTENPLTTNWTTVTATNYTGMAKTGGSAVGIASEWNAAYWDANVPANNQYARITLTGSPSYHGVILRDGASGFYTAYVTSHGNRVYVQRLDKSGMTYTSLVSGSAYSTTTVPSGATLELRMSGSTLTCLINGTPINGTLLTDTTYPSGNFGIITYGTVSGIASFDAGDL